jgi:hypothetical protein
MEQEDGGPAFPVPGATKVRSDGYFDPQSGMSLRDYFAAKALAGIPQPLCSLHDVEAAYMRTATHCYRMADAMLKARTHPQVSGTNPKE